jgi:hypothetical protein
MIKKDLAKLPILVLSTFGHCGIDWFGNLLDSHKEILMIPALSYFRRLEFLKEKKIDIKSLSILDISKVIIEEICRKSSFKSYNFFLFQR